MCEEAMIVSTQCRGGVRWGHRHSAGQPSDSSAMLHLKPLYALRSLSASATSVRVGLILLRLGTKRDFIWEFEIVKISLARCAVFHMFYKRGSNKGDAVTCIKCAIAAKRKALDWRAVFSSHCVYLWDFQRRPYYFIGGNPERAKTKCQQDSIVPERSQISLQGEGSICILQAARNKSARPMGATGDNDVIQRTSHESAERRANYGAATSECKSEGNPQSGTTLICDNPGATPPGIEPGSRRWDASSLTTTPLGTLTASGRQARQPPTRILSLVCQVWEGAWVEAHRELNSSVREEEVWCEQRQCWWVCGAKTSTLKWSRQAPQLRVAERRSECLVREGREGKRRRCVNVSARSREGPPGRGLSSRRGGRRSSGDHFTASEWRARVQQPRLPGSSPAQGDFQNAHSTRTKHLSSRVEAMAHLKRLSVSVLSLARFSTSISSPGGQAGRGGLLSHGNFLISSHDKSHEGPRWLSGQSTHIPAKRSWFDSRWVRTRELWRTIPLVGGFFPGSSHFPCPFRRRCRLTSPSSALECLMLAATPDLLSSHSYEVSYEVLFASCKISFGDDPTLPSQPGQIPGNFTCRVMGALML
ncbi:hypothetical protein PR048_030644 [Dryococelus australis]|uniref:Uncharacterized protein n=1 Tax=Dryococelus australis TaxID=614101 RepID=A0ABQ9GCB5_9NEOP|nr:hypothetical protein PR048_030644 [Dryococelus australis]